MGGPGVPFPAPFPKYRNHFFCSRNSMANSTLVNSKSAAHRAGQGGVNTNKCVEGMLSSLGHKGKGRGWVPLHPPQTVPKTHRVRLAERKMSRCCTFFIFF